MPDTEYVSTYRVEGADMSRYHGALADADVPGEVITVLVGAKLVPSP